MENNFMLTDTMLWDYADGFLQADEKLRVEAYLRQHPEQQAHLEAIMAEKRAFTGLVFDKPDTGFANQVMAAWAAEQTPSTVLLPNKAKGRDWILWSIAAAFALIMSVPFIISSAASPGDVVLQIPAQYVPQFQFPAFDWAGFFDSALLRNTALLTIAFLGLKLLDKYLQVRNLILSK